MPSASTSRSLYSNFAYSAITRNVVVKAACDRAQQQILRRPPAFETSKFGRGGEVNRIGGRIGLRGSSSAGSPPSYYAIFVFFFHDVTFYSDLDRTAVSAVLCLESSVT